MIVFKDKPEIGDFIFKMNDLYSTQPTILGRVCHIAKSRIHYDPLCMILDNESSTNIPLPITENERYIIERDLPSDHFTSNTVFNVNNTPFVMEKSVSHCVASFEEALFIHIESKRIEYRQVLFSRMERLQTQRKWCFDAYNKLQEYLEATAPFQSYDAFLLLWESEYKKEFDRFLACKNSLFKSSLISTDFHINVYNNHRYISPSEWGKYNATDADQQ